MFILQIVADLSAQVNDLEETRRERFLDWLNKHHRTNQPTIKETLPVFLNTWLGGLNPEGLQWENQLLQDEITWWRNLSAAHLWRILEEERSE